MISLLILLIDTKRQSSGQSMSFTLCPSNALVICTENSNRVFPSGCPSYGVWGPFNISSNNISYTGSTFNKSETIKATNTTIDRGKRCSNEPVISNINIIPVIGAFTVAAKCPAIASTPKLIKYSCGIPSLIQINPTRLPAKTPTPKRGKDRKSTRLNSSHANISYAVFCLKKKKTIKHEDEFQQRSYE